MSSYEVSFSRSFSRSLKRLLRSGSFDYEKLQSIVDNLVSGNMLSRGIKDHALKADWAGYRECHIESDLLLIYKVEGNVLVLAYLGTHSELFGK